MLVQTISVLKVRNGPNATGTLELEELKMTTPLTQVPSYSSLSSMTNAAEPAVYFGALYSGDGTIAYYSPIARRRPSDS